MIVKVGPRQRESGDVFLSTSATNTFPERAGIATAGRSAVLSLFSRLGAGPVIEDTAVRARMIDGMLPPAPTGVALPRAARSGRLAPAVGPAPPG